MLLRRPDYVPFLQKVKDLKPEALFVFVPSGEGVGGTVLKSRRATSRKNSMNTIEVKMVRKTREAEDIASFELASVHGEPLPSFSAGSHIDVRIADGLTRQYSLCNDPQDKDRYLIAVLDL